LISSIIKKLECSQISEFLGFRKNEIAANSEIDAKYEIRVRNEIGQKKRNLCNK